MIDVCLVLMPYADVERPSIALGLLKACLQEHGIRTTALYPNIRFAEKIGLDIYKAMSDSIPADLLGEWTFSGAAFPDFQPDHAEYLRLLQGSVGDVESLKQLIWWVREQTASFVDSVARHILKLQPRIVACSSMFQQHCASLALLRRIRELDPQVITLMGGANCEGAMGQATKREFPWVDFVCSGEGDDLFYDLCRQLLDRGRDIAPQDLPYGVIGATLPNNNVVKSEAPRASVENLDKIPIPDYGDYFETLRASEIAPFVEPGLPIETSRGCWWGQKHHCTFCGLNGSGMSYRSKSPERVLREFAHLQERYGLGKFQVVDNILDMNHINTVIPTFTGLQKKYEIFYETKANLKREQLQLLADAGVRWLQPGIESLHDSVLKLLNKGNTALMNVQFLKWARELGSRVYWNFLLGAPGESDSWYTEMLEWLPLIVHLQPPTSAAQLRYDRFSPYHEQPEQWGLKLSPNNKYFYIYPLAPAAMADLAYYFEDDSDSALSLARQQFGGSGKQALQRWSIKWLNLFWSKQPPTLSMIDEGDRLKIVDTRPCAIESELSLSGLAYWVYLACDRALTSQEILQTLRQQHRLDVSMNEIESVTAELCQQKIMLAINGRFLSLALRSPIPSLPENRESPGGYTDIRRFQQFASQKLESQRTA